MDTQRARSVAQGDTLPSLVHQGIDTLQGILDALDELISIYNGDSSDETSVQTSSQVLKGAENGKEECSWTHDEDDDESKANGSRDLATVPSLGARRTSSISMSDFDEEDVYYERIFDENGRAILLANYPDGETIEVVMLGFVWEPQD